MRGAVIFFGLASLAFVLVIRNIEGVLQLTISLGGWTMGPLMGLFFIGLMMPWVGANAACIGGLSGVVFLFTVGIRSQLAIISGDLVFQPKPVSTENCDYQWSNATVSQPGEYYTSGSHISYMLYNLFGVVINVTVANIWALDFGRQDMTRVDPMLLVPSVRRFTVKK